ncbi:MAG: ubiquinone/menaquinone biosynthesis methyltransferase [Thermoanaerobaculia bacterium]
MLDKNPDRIQSMFAEIAPRYDRANRVLSIRIDTIWRRRVARALLPGRGRVLDLAAGTGDLSIDLARVGNHRVVAADFTFEMLLAGKAKLAQHAPSTVPCAADALRLPFRNATFDGVTVAFGVRNFADPVEGLREMFRVLRDGGAAAVLEFSIPRGIFGRVYDFYFRHVLPFAGGLLTGRRAAYEYLPASVGAFPEGPAFVELMERAGFVRVTARRMTGGICTFYRGEKP